MNYSASELAKLSGVTTRALRFYEQKGLLKPRREDNGYRVYEGKDIDRLQEILFFKSAGMPIFQIQSLLAQEDYDRQAALENQLKKLEADLALEEKLIATLKKTLDALKHEKEMTQMEKFEGLKEKMLLENEAKFGKEIRKKYGEQTVEASNNRFKNMNEERLSYAQSLSEQIDQGILSAMQAGDPGSETALKTCEAHKQWLCLYWPEGMYTKQAHLSLAQTYVDDERFKAYYDRIAPGAAVFFKQMIDRYCE